MASRYWANEEYVDKVLAHLAALSRRAGVDNCKSAESIAKFHRVFLTTKNI